MPKKMPAPENRPATVETVPGMHQNTIHVTYAKGDVTRSASVASDGSAAALCAAMRTLADMIERDLSN